jgi:hypothetical protein
MVFSQAVHFITDDLREGLSFASQCVSGPGLTSTSPPVISSFLAATQLELLL